MRTPIEPRGEQLRLATVQMRTAFEDKAAYEAVLKPLQERMRRLQHAYFHQGRRAVIVFEGWDAAGKGGSIRRLTAGLDPRGYSVYPIAAPKPEEQGRHYLYRFWERLPPPGTLAVFDRSWYGRVLVEKVEGFATPAEVLRAYDEINEFERMLIDDGVRVVKLFLHISKEEQLRRFEERLENPYKRWKITLEDLRNRDRWDAYVHAIERMLERTDTTAAPWTVIGADRKWQTRVAVLDTALARLSRGVKLDPPPVDPEVLALARTRLGYRPPEQGKGATKTKQGGRKGRSGPSKA